MSDHNPKTCDVVGCVACEYQDEADAAKAQSYADGLAEELREEAVKLRMEADKTLDDIYANALIDEARDKEDAAAAIEAGDWNDQVANYVMDAMTDETMDESQQEEMLRANAECGDELSAERLENYFPDVPDFAEEMRIRKRAQELYEEEMKKAQDLKTGESDGR